MRYLSVCAGIEAATVAWHHMGWQAAGYSEIEKFPGLVLEHHYPDVPKLGDMTKYKEWDIGTIDILAGGTPCQSFSVAGLRKGLDDPRGNLALVYCGILDHFRPQWFVWENVPGVLSSNGGRDFGSFLGALAELGYGFAYRVLDAQWFGVAQRRRRVFVVGCLGDWRRAAAVLFERQSLRRDLAPSREAGQKVAPTVVQVPPYSRTGNERVECDAIVAMAHGQANAEIRTDGACPTLTCVHEAPIATAYSVREDAKANNFSATPLETSTALQALRPGVQSHHAQVFVAQPMAVRRLTPTECERLQGFPDGYTDIQPNGKPTPDSVRYKALGNSMAVPVMRWIGERINGNP
jgi:DNA (cytosine-5)-methyltransferase 1